MSEIVTGIIAALVAIILTLAGVLKLYLPKVKKNNPVELTEIRQVIQKINESLRLHLEMSARDHNEVMDTLKRIEQKLK